MKRFARILGALAAASLLTSTAVAETRDPATLDSREAQAIAQSLTVLRELQAIPDQRIPDLLLSKAEGIVILPANVKVGLIFGARFGNGVMLVRNEDRSWSNPVFVSTGGGSWASFARRRMRWNTYRLAKCIAPSDRSRSPSFLASTSMACVTDTVRSASRMSDAYPRFTR